MHTHFEFSPDSQTTLEEQVLAIRKAKLDVVCATDHDTIEGARRLEEVADGFGVVVGEEVSSREGELIGLFLERAIPPGLNAEATIRAIHEQGGIVSVPHPFSPTRPNRIRRQVLDRIWPQIDCIEVLNGRVVSEADNRRAYDYAAERNIRPAVGSDAHRVAELGAAWLEMDEFIGPSEFIAALRGGIVHTRHTGLRSTRVFSPYRALRKWLRGEQPDSSAR
jgi:predicted metal-dependent phosphoesterase TrpH